MTFDTVELILRILFAALMGGIVGLEREAHDQPAGFRTHALLSTGAALTMVLSIMLPVEYKRYVLSGDPARLAAQVVSGIGFLGAGAILRYGTNVKGLTTAASLWAIAIVGLAAGAGKFYLALSTTGLLLVILEIMDWIEKIFVRHRITRTIKVSGELTPEDEKNILSLFKDIGVKVKKTSLKKDVQRGEIAITYLVKVKQKLKPCDITEVLTKTIKNIRGVEID